MTITELLRHNWGGSFDYNNTVLDTIDFRIGCAKEVTVKELRKQLNLQVRFYENDNVPDTTVLSGVALCVARTFGSLCIMAAIDDGNADIPFVDDKKTAKYQPEFNDWKECSKNWGANKYVYDHIEHWFNQWAFE